MQHKTTPMPLPLSYTDYAEQPPLGEEDDIERTISLLRETLKRQLDRHGESRRDVHVKSHGYFACEFQVRSELPAELSQGLFIQPRTFRGFVRFSNSAPWSQPDALPDGRGLALQVEHDLEPRIFPDNVGMTQDFVMVNNSTFIARDVKDYLKLQEARLEATLKPAQLTIKLLRSVWNPLHWRWRALSAAVQVASQSPSHPANYTYYSMVPFRYGQYMAKFRLLPTNPQPSFSLGIATAFGGRANAMRWLLEQTLARQEITFDFQVQLRTSDRSMPIEDATIEWPQSESPYRTVAQLVIPTQRIPGSQVDDGERRAFNVWNSLIDHRPLGGINRVRRQAYAVSSAYRNAGVSR